MNATLTRTFLLCALTVLSARATAQATCPGIAPEFYTLPSRELNKSSANPNVITINKFGACFILTARPGSTSYFIPLKTGLADTPMEWANFRNHLPPSIASMSCTSPAWSVSGWSPCSASASVCGNGVGTQTRQVGCLSYDCSTGQIRNASLVANSICQQANAMINPGDDLNFDSVPDSTRSCDVVCQPVAGSCGAANEGSFYDTTALNGAGLCGASSTASAVVGNWSWSCAGPYGGSTATCHAHMKIDGLCGSANGGVFTDSNQINQATLCGANSVSSGVSLSKGSWAWACSGQNGGGTANCTASEAAADGICGTAESTATYTTPTTNLCSIGNASAVHGVGGPYDIAKLGVYGIDDGAWQWTCDTGEGGYVPTCEVKCSCANGNFDPLTLGPKNFCCTASLDSTGSRCKVTEQHLRGSGEQCEQTN